MTASTTGWKLGRNVFGLAALGFGLIAVRWHEYGEWHQPPYLLYSTGAGLICGGVAIQFRRAAKVGAVVVGVVYLIFALLCVPRIVAAPLVYNNWGNFFEQVSLVTGAVMVYARWSAAWSEEKVKRVGCILVGVCTASFGLEQAFYLGATASLVPKWIPPSPMFWAVATTIFFALAAVALLANRMVVLAARLLTIMLLSFGLIVWVPLLLAAPSNHTNWSETVETFAIAGTAWVVADLLREDPPRVASRK
jgi:hypothetical protein